MRIGEDRDSFLELAKRLCKGDHKLAYHLWTACDMEGDCACHLHVDDLDAGHLLVCGLSRA